MYPDKFDFDEEANKLGQSVLRLLNFRREKLILCPVPQNKIIKLK